MGKINLERHINSKFCYDAHRDNDHHYSSFWCCNVDVTYLFISTLFFVYCEPTHVVNNTLHKNSRFFGCSDVWVSFWCSLIFFEGFLITLICCFLITLIAEQGHPPFADQKQRAKLSFLQLKHHTTWSHFCSARGGPERGVNTNHP